VLNGVTIMSASPEQPHALAEEGAGAKDAPYWAKGDSRLRVEAAPAGAINLNVDGRMVTGPIQGFGKMWQKTYRVPLPGADVTPADVIREWKAHFPEFWPPGNHFYGPITGLAPGDVALLNLALPGRQKLSTGVLVLYADDESFTLMTPQGHMFAGWITFSACVDAGGTTAQAQVLMRASDPVYEVGLALGGHRQEDRFWEHTLTQLAAHFGLPATVEIRATCIDSRRQWRRAGNVWHNAGIRTGMYVALAPVRWTTRIVRRDAGRGMRDA
jgi:hypothetical protein